MEYPRLAPAPTELGSTRECSPPPDPDAERELRRGPNIKPLPDLEPLPETIQAPVLLVLGDGVSTDEIMPAGSALQLALQRPRAGASTTSPRSTKTRTTAR